MEVFEYRKWLRGHMKNFWAVNRVDTEKNGPSHLSVVETTWEKWKKWEAEWQDVRQKLNEHGKFGMDSNGRPVRIPLDEERR